MRGPLLACLLAFAPVFAGAEDAPPAPVPDVRDRPFSKAAVAEVVADRRHEVQACYEQAMAARGATAETAPRGRVVMAWTITEDGLAAEVRVLRSAVRDGLVTDCITERIRYWEFPRPPVRQPVEFPFDLQPAGAAAGGERDRN